MSFTDNLMPIRQESLTTDYDGGPSNFVCVDDGTVTVTWKDTTTTEFTFRSGDSFRFFAVDCARVQVTSGTFLNIFLG